MSTDLDYKGKHKRVLRDGQTPRGPKRWARAFGNLLEHPTSRAASLLVDRITTAGRFREYAGWAEPWEHIQVYTPATRETARTRKYLTCNAFCAAMVIQLDIESTDWKDVAHVFDGTYRRTFTIRGVKHEAYYQDEVRKLNRTELVRSARCQFCGNKVEPASK